MTLQPSNPSTLLGDHFAQAAGPPSITVGRTGKNNHALQTSSETQNMASPLKRPADAEGFEYPKTPCRPKTPEPPAPPKTRNMFEGLQTLVDVPPSTSSAHQASPSSQAPKKRRTPHIFVKIAKIEDPPVAPRCYFEYVATGLRVQTKNKVEHATTTETLKKEGIVFFTYNPNPGSTIKFVLRGLPSNASCEEIAQEIKNAGTVLTHAKQMTKHSIHPETREQFVAPLPFSQ